MYFNENHYPQQFILIGSDPLFHETESEHIVQEAVALYPDEFSGECQSFEHTLRYVAPYERSFDEIRRLQGIAAFHAGRRNDFRGYIILDVSEYIHHESEFYFDALLAFLYDQSDVWKYIFCIRTEKPNQKSVAPLVRKLLSIPLCQVFEQALPGRCYDTLFIQRACLENGLECFRSAETFFADILSEDVSRDAVSLIFNEIAGKYGTKNKVSLNLLKQYFSSPSPCLKYVLTPHQNEVIMMRLERENKKGSHHDEKA